MSQKEQHTIDWGNPSAADFRKLKDAIHEFPAVRFDCTANRYKGGWEVFMYEVEGEEAYDVSATFAPLIGLPGKLLPLHGPEEYFQLVSMVAACDLIRLMHWMADVQAELAETCRKSN